MKEQTASKVPQIRFKGSGREWEERRLGTVCTIGDADHWMPETTAQGIPYVMTGDFFGINEIDFENAKLISLEDFEKLSRKIKPELGDILFARYASIGSVRYVNTTRKFIASYSCAILKGSGSFNGEYLFFLLQSSTIQNQLKESINTGSQGNVGIESLKQLATRFPSHTEQTQIGEYFRELDSLIGLHQRKHDKLVTLKKAMLQKMFPQPRATTPEIRFKGFSGDWVEKTLGELMPITSAARVHKHEWTRSGVPFFRTSDVVSLYKGEKNALAFISLDLYEKLSDKIGRIKRGDILITGGGSIGIPFLAKSDEPLYFKDADLLWLKVPASIDSIYLYTFFSSDLFRKYLGSISHIGTIGHYTVEQAKKTPITIPLQAEQEKIGTYFCQLDALISKHAIQLQKLQQLKSACLEKMFV